MSARHRGSQNTVSSPSRSRARSGIVGLTMLMLCMHAHAVTDNRFHRAPPLGDAYKAWTLRSLGMLDAQSLGDFHPLQADVSWRLEYLENPSSIYSDLHPRLFAALSGEMPRPDVYPGSPSDGRVVAWDLGFDKALIGFQALPEYPQKMPVGGHHPLVAASMEKAGVRRLYFDLGYRLAGEKLRAIGAEIAVALEILRDWVNVTPVEDQGILGVDPYVLGRFEVANKLSDLPDSDLAYLADVLRSELSIWRAGRANSVRADGTPQRELPTPLRIGRVAAAYRTSQAPLYTACLADGQRDPAEAGDVPEDLSRPICFTDATDRATYRWYRATRQHELSQQPDAFPNFSDAARLIDHFGDIRPAWAGAYNNNALDWSNHAEIVEAQMALTGEASATYDMTFYRLVERANLLICRRALR